MIKKKNHPLEERLSKRYYEQQKSSLFVLLIINIK